jgi:hypothetical protein
MLANDEDALHSFCARILGWTTDREVVVEHALRSIELAVSHQTALMLLGNADLVRIAQALHRRTLGAERPFVVCDPRRRSTPASARSPPSYEDGGEAFVAAAGGTLCVYRRRLPRDFSALVAMFREPDASVQLVICGGRHDKYEALLAALAPIVVPSLHERSKEIPRIVEEYATDAIAALSSTVPFTAKDRDWICKHSASSLHEIEDATLRVVALRQAGSVLRAARLLNMSHAALNEWFAIRRPARSARKRDAYDPRATNQRARRSKLLGISHSSLGEWFQQKRKTR